MDFAELRVGAERASVLLLLDDYSRFIVGYARYVEQELIAHHMSQPDGTQGRDKVEALIGTFAAGAAAGTPLRVGGRGQGGSRGVGRALQQASAPCGWTDFARPMRVFGAQVQLGAMTRLTCSSTGPPPA